MSAQCQRGFSLVELLVAIGVAGIFWSLTGVALFKTNVHLEDEKIRVSVQQQAQTLRHIIAADLKKIGNGLPLGQLNFSPGTTGLSDAPLAVLLDADNDFIRFRVNETGSYTLLTASYTPSVVSLRISVFTTAGLQAGDTIYLSDMPVGGENGLQGTIRSISGNTLLIASNYISSPGVSFPIGSSLQKISTITYVSPADGSGVLRRNSSEEILLEPNTTFSLEYLDQNASTISLPLTNVKVRDNLSSLNLLVSARSVKHLRTGGFYTVTVRQRIALRNLFLSR